MKRKISQSDINLAMDWATGLIGITEVCKKKKTTPSSAYVFLAMALRNHVIKGTRNN